MKTALARNSDFVRARRTVEFAEFQLAHFEIPGCPRSSSNRGGWIKWEAAAEEPGTPAPRRFLQTSRTSQLLSILFARRACVNPSLRSARFQIANSEGSCQLL